MSKTVGFLALLLLTGCGAFTTAPKPQQKVQGPGCTIITKKGPVTIWQQAIGEILGFINGARTQKELEKFGCYWWRWWDCYRQQREH